MVVNLAYDLRELKKLVEPATSLLPTEGQGQTYASLLRLYGVSEEEDFVPQQVKASPRGRWCNPAVGRAFTRCGKPLGAYALRDETYLGDLCLDGCFTHFELNVLAPQEVERYRAQEEAERLQEQERWARWEAARARFERRSEDEVREFKDEIKGGTGEDEI